MYCFQGNLHLIIIISILLRLGRDAKMENKVPESIRLGGGEIREIGPSRFIHWLHGQKKQLQALRCVMPLFL